MVYRPGPGIRAAGFKIMYQQVAQHPGVLPYFAVRRVRAIHLVRANLLDAVISYEVVKATGEFHSLRGEGVPRAMVSIDALALRERLQDMEWQIAHGRTWLERYRLPRIDIACEELLGRRDETLERVLRFLGVDPEVDALDSALVRMGAHPPLELVENAEDARAALAGTRFEWMLDGARP
jgi:LPS sulfotransferase NodH